VTTMLGFIVLVAVSIHLAPQLTRRDIFFGVTRCRTLMTSSSPHQSALEHERGQHKGKRAAHRTDDEVSKIALIRSG
jgi:hypothetical protein